MFYLLEGHNFFLLKVLCLWVFCLNLWLHIRCVSGAWEGLRFPGTGVSDSCDPPSEYWESNPVPQEVLLTAKPSLQPALKALLSIQNFCSGFWTVKWNEVILWVRDSTLPSACCLTWSIHTYWLCKVGRRGLILTILSIHQKQALGDSFGKKIQRSISGSTEH